MQSPPAPDSLTLLPSPPVLVGVYDGITYADGHVFRVNLAKLCEAVAFFDDPNACDSYDSFTDAIDAAFEWACTPQGHDFWSEVCDQGWSDDGGADWVDAAAEALRTFAKNARPMNPSHPHIEVLAAAHAVHVEARRVCGEGATVEWYPLGAKWSAHVCPGDGSGEVEVGETAPDALRTLARWLRRLPNKAPAKAATAEPWVCPPTNPDDFLI